MAIILGIDLGTTNSLCAVFRDGAPQLLPNSLGKYLTPSVVGLLDDGRIVVGEAARELRVTRPECCASMFKRYMGSDTKTSLGERTFTAPELSSLVLKSLRDDAEKALGVECSEAVITVPAYFNDAQRKATRMAGKLAGMNVRRIVNEPTAAALTYGFHDRGATKKLIVIDLGGGTFDVTLMEVFEGTLEIISTAGESFLGGEDFTDRLVAVLLTKQGVNFELAELQQPLRVARLRQLCEEAKRALTQEDEVTVRLPDDQGLLGEKVTTVRVTRSAFASAVKPLVDRLAAPIGKVLRDGICPVEEVDDVILVGGATRMPAVVDYVRGYFKTEPLATFNPDEVVALGAAVQAALIADDRAVDDMVMTDVCPYTLGIEVSKQLASEHRAGYYAPIIHRNTTIPVSREHSFSTIVANQTEVTVRVFQGESRKVEKNHKLGELQVKGIPPGPAGQEFQVRFTYDLNGILEVEAYVPGVGRKFSTVLTQHAADLDEDELKAALAKMQALKYYPREDMATQNLLRVAERAVGEVSPYARPQLEAAIDFLENAMSSGDRALVESACEAVGIVLSSLGFSSENADE